MRGNNCTRCIYTDSPCVPSDYGRDEHNNCEHYKSVFEENKEIYKKMAELDTALEDCTESLTDARIKIKELEEENAELKEKLEIEQNARGDWFGKAVSKDRRLTEAKELIRNLLRVTYGEGWNYSLDVKVKAENFLKEDK